MNTQTQSPPTVVNAHHMWSKWKNRPYQDTSSYTLMKQSLLVQELVYHTLRECVVNRLRRVSGYLTFDKVVDLGCATGEWTMAYKRFCRHAVGVDINPLFIEEAERRVGGADADHVSFIAGNLANYRDFAGVDLVCSGGCLMYIDEDNLTELFNTIREEMVPGGLVYIRASVANRRREAYESTAGFYRKPAFYEQLLESNGFEIVDAATSGAVVSHELLRESFFRRRDPLADALLLKAVEKAAVVKQFFLNKRKNNHMNWIARKVDG